MPIRIMSLLNQIWQEGRLKNRLVEIQKHKEKKSNHLKSSDMFGELSWEATEGVCFFLHVCSTCFESHSYLTQGAMN